MPNNLEALQTLKQSATEQKNELESTIKEIHKQSLQELNKSLQSTYNTSMKSLENAIQNRLEKSVQKSINTKNWIIIALTALVSLSVAIPTTWYLKPAEKVQAQEIIKAPPPITHSAQPNTDVTEQITKLMIENKNLRSDNTKKDQAIKSYQAQIKELRAWSILESNQGTTKDGRKWMKTSEVTTAENGKSWALIEKK